MKFTLSALTFLSLLSIAKAELLESNVTIQLKVHEQQEEVIKNGVATSVYKTRSLKTADVIQLIAEAEEEVFSKKARLILRTIVVNGSPEPILIIRDGTRDYELKEVLRMGFSEHILAGGDEAYVGKIRQDSQKLSEKAFGPGFSDICPYGGQAAITISGLLQRSRNTIQSKEFPSLTINLASYSLTGVGSHVLGEMALPYFKVAQGSIKISPPKVMPTPLE